ncbi:hypothetical protein [Caulobacter sp. BP25]|uniref:hypothetical protein n=1 Tax=Caulobacter sp. BP25 TaxID=2048900 RepID=UPI000C12BEEF|nr:hypothetical protein [Caulobacter sp. BP25]PHY22202.1 hypothetical protein CSW59_01910 [Caulobacter sp. BP25]
MAAGILRSLKAFQDGAKGLAAPGGWVFLINDTNDFLSWQFGLKRWSPEERETVEALLADRMTLLGDRHYQMVICPEKSVVYSEWLPSGLADIAANDERPATVMASAASGRILYLADRFEQLKRFGLLFFRGDTHVNFLGAYHLYREAILALKAGGAPVGDPIAFGQLQHFVAGMEGDIFIQLPEAAKDDFEIDASLGRVGNMLEVLMSHTLPEARKRTRRVETPEGYIPGGGGRETVIMEHEDPSLPKALVFRDSTATLSIDLLAQHFSRSVYVWHEGDVIGELIDREQPDVILHFVAERFLATYPRAVAINRHVG